MFAVAGTIKKIEFKNKSKEYFNLILTKKKGDSEYPLSFYVFNNELVKDFKDEKFIEGDNVEITFYIKGRENNGYVTNNLYADKVAVLKRNKSSKVSE